MLFLQPLFGGILIGLAVSLMLYLNGRVTGVSGILNASLQRPSRESFWRWSFIAGLLAGGVLMQFLRPAAFELSTKHLGTLIFSGLLVGFGTVMGSGCTSGHGICGLSRFSLRSLIATITFMTFGIVAATLARVYFAGSL